MKNTYRHKGFGLSFEAPFYIPELPETDVDPQIIIRLEKELDISGIEKFNNHLNRINENKVLLIKKNVARILIKDNREIIVEKKPECENSLLRFFLLSSVIGALLHLRNFLPLHGSAIEYANQAIVFIGRKGMGKSTILYNLYQKGYQFLSDDISSVRLTNGVPYLYPGSFRLNIESNQIDSKVEYQAMRYSNSSKNALLLPDSFCEKKLRVKRVYILVKEIRGDSCFETIHGANGTLEMISNIYRKKFIHILNRKETFFNNAIEFSRNVQFRKTDVMRGIENVNNVIDLLESDFRER